MRIEDLKQYEIVEQKVSKDLNSDSYLLRHKKTGARIFLLSNDDDNKVFYIGFKTPPADSTGVAHILEHSVLCGSKNFPSKDPFVELVKGSLNTFLNAMTYSDKTLYPIASCNDKDFQNLMHIYLDAVFYPNIYKESRIFSQEGWHYELEDETDDITINGVVYNEMKGAFSSPDDILDREVFCSLFPDTAYGFESGGDPECIPQLTYEEFLDFHKKYYHPSNSYIYLYGDMDMAEKLQWIDENYLKEFDQIPVSAILEEQKEFSEIRETVINYPITSEESEKDNTYLAYNTVVGKSLDKDLYLAFQILDYALCSAPGAPLKQALIDKGIGNDVYSVFENGILQPFFSVVSKGANPEQKQAFLDTIQKVLEEQVRSGIDKKSLRAGCNYIEFRYKEADFGSYPKGLMYGLQSLESWLYDDSTPLLHIEANLTFAKLKKAIDSSYYEKMIQTYLLDNTHKSFVMVVPKQGLGSVKEEAAKQALAEFKATLSQEEIKQMISKTESLATYQEEPNSQEDIEKIPLLQREDIKKEAEAFCNEERQIGKVPMLFHDIFTNEIGYIKLVFKIDTLPQEYLPYLGILKSVLCFMDTEHYSYPDLFNEVNQKTGGITSSLNTYINATNITEFTTTFEVKCKALYENMGEGFTLLEEVIFRTKFDNDKRLLEILQELKSRMQGNMQSSGHSVAASRAMSYFSKPAGLSEITSGITFYNLLEDIIKNYETESKRVIAYLQELMQFIFRPENLLFDYTSSEDGVALVESGITELYDKLYVTPVEKKPFVIETCKKNEGFETAAKVQYVCSAGNYRSQGLEYTGALRVLKVIMGYEYLWSQIRVKGGAYGCMCNFSKSGDSYFVSYRDPNLGKTLEVYKKAVSYIKEFTVTEREVTKFIIGTISDLDTPLNPSAKGSRSLGAYLCNLSYDEIQQERDEVLSVTVSQIRDLAKYIEALLAQDCLCVVGNSEKIKENKSLFLKITNLFS